MDNKIKAMLKRIENLFNIYETEELSLRDIDYVDSQFEEAIDDMKRLKEDIINERFIKSFEEI